MAFNVRELARVTHLGTWPVASTRPRTPSFEGIGLSVSQHPDAWRHIAKLGGLPELVLARRDRKPGRFVDGYAALPDARRWGLARGFIIERRAWKVTYWDDEWEDQMSYEVLDRAEALDEARERGGKASQSHIIVAAGQLKQRLDAAYGRSLGPGSPTIEAELLNRYLVLSEARIDGVWWDDALDPVRLSAPRGLILPESLPEWRVVSRRQPPRR